ncbi:Phospholipid-transporting ATPase 6, partial [Fragariocoptes setiger]
PESNVVHLLEWETASRDARDGSAWTRLGADRQRFHKNRVVTSENILNSILQSSHRQKIYLERFKDFHPTIQPSNELAATLANTETLTPTAIEATTVATASSNTTINEIDTIDNINITTTTTTAGSRSPLIRTANPTEMGDVSMSHRHVEPFGIVYRRHKKIKFLSNRITTAKYSWSTFFPKFLFEQFRRYSNIFFSFIALFQQIPNVSPTGRYTTAVPLICILGVSAIKELFEDLKRHKADKKINNSEIHVLNRITLHWDIVRWQDVKVGDIVRCVSDNFFPSDMLLLASSEPNGMCYIETANLDGETNLKIRQSLECTASCLTSEELKQKLAFSSIDCDLPNPKLYEFEGKLHLGTEQYALGPDNILLRGAKLKNTNWIYSVVLYTGHESKLMINSLAETPIKQSALEKLTNIQILWLVFILLTTGFLSAIFSQIWNYGNQHWYIFSDPSATYSFPMTYLTFVILYNNLVPISLQVSLEVVRSFQAHFINCDIEMYDEERQTYAMARTSNLNEELGQVRYILSDKTGTLTRNVMEFKKCSVAGRMFDETSLMDLAEAAQNEPPYDYRTATSHQGPVIVNEGSAINENKYYSEFLTLLAVCHTVVPEHEEQANKRREQQQQSMSGYGKLLPRSDNTPHEPQQPLIAVAPVEMQPARSPLPDISGQFEASNNSTDDELIINDKLQPSSSSGVTAPVAPATISTHGILYHAASPDEGALVRGAQQIGFEFTNRTPKHVHVNRFGREEKYEILNVFEFDSTRKRMSVVTRGPDNNIKIYTKGADTVIYERLASPTLTEVTAQHLERFANDGFRTLCCAFAHIPVAKYEEWAARYQQANLLNGTEREQRLEECQQELERDLILLGATAIEDKLQDCVPDTIDTLLRAGICFWLLTGDKQETAINIGFSCKLLKRGMPLIIINEESFDATRKLILETNVNNSVDTALVIDGKSLSYALSSELKNEFMRIALNCKSVICCRVSPFQKAEMVESVKVITNQVTLAIGDGANDVAMIRTAHIGVGISGREGLQAAHSADYTISQFRFLARLLLVHGSWSLARLRQMILYSFYKNIALYVVEFWFAIVSGWSGQTIFERWTIGLYNVIFTAAPPFAMGVFDRKCSAETMLKYPQLYKSQMMNQNYTMRTFWLWILTAFWHSLLLFWFTYGLIRTDALWSDGKSDGGYLVFGNMLYTYVVVTVCLKAGLEISSWTSLTHAAIWGSIVSWFLFLMAYSRFWPTLPLAADMAAIDSMVFGTPVFWLGLLLIPFTALVTDIVYKVMRRTCFTTPEDQIMERQPIKPAQELCLRPRRQ